MGKLCQKSCRSLARVALIAGAVGIILIGSVNRLFAQADASVPSIVRAVGTVKSVARNTAVITTDSGTSVNVSVQDSTRLLRAAPGQKDLQAATPLKLSDLQVGDRMLVRGKAGKDPNSVEAMSIVVMKGADIATKKQEEQADWQKRGIGGLVTAANAASGTVAVSVAGFGGNKTVVVHVSKGTIIRRYAPDSVKFDDAKPGTLDQVKTGDQLRARGDRSADGTDLTAEEVVSGTFRNIAGTVISSDPTNHTLTVTNLATKKPVTLKIADDSQMRNLPQMMAERIARRLKGGSAQSSENGVAASFGAGNGQAGEGKSGGFRNGRPSGAPDFQQILSRMPAVELKDLQKGNAVMIVATEGSAMSPSTAITLLTGVEPILTASPNGQAAMLLSPWNLNGAGGAEAAMGANP